MGTDTQDGKLNLWQTSIWWSGPCSSRSLEETKTVASDAEQNRAQTCTAWDTDTWPMWHCLRYPAVTLSSPTIRFVGCGTAEHYRNAPCMLNQVIRSTRRQLPITRINDRMLSNERPLHLISKQIQNCLYLKTPSAVLWQSSRKELCCHNQPFNCSWRPAWT